MKSIRANTLLGIFVFQAVLLLVAGSALYLVVRSLMVSQFDSALESKLAVLGMLLEQEGNTFELNFTSEMMPEFETGNAPEYFQIWVDGIGTLARSDSLELNELPRPPEARLPFIRNLTLPDGRTGRMIEARVKIHEYEALPWSNPGPAEPVIAFARGTEHLDEIIGSFRQRLFLIGGSLVVLSMLLAWLAVHRGLRPLERLARHVETIYAPSSITPLKLNGFPQELKVVAGRLNELSERLEAAFDREHRTTANIAHELRTPVAELKAMSEVALKWSDDEEYNEKVIAQAHEISVHMQSVIETLLKLARVESGSFQPEERSIALEAVLDRAWADQAAAARRKDLRIEQHVPADAMAFTDRSVLEIIVANLLSNAVKHSESGGHLTSDVGVGNGRVLLRISNLTDTLQKRDLDKLTEPFWRGEDSRERGKGVGLGLALVEQLAERSGMEVRFKLRDRRFSAILSMPTGSKTAANRPAEAENGRQHLRRERQA